MIVNADEGITIIYVDSKGKKHEITFDSVNSLIAALAEDVSNLEQQRKKATDKKEERSLYRKELLIIKGLLNMKSDYSGKIQYR